MLSSKSSRNAGEILEIKEAAQMSLLNDLHQPIERLTSGENKKWRLRFGYHLTNQKISEGIIFSCCVYGLLDDTKQTAKTFLGMLLRPPQGAQGYGSVFIECVKSKRFLGFRLPNYWKAVYLIDYDTEKRTFGERPIPE